MGYICEIYALIIQIKKLRSFAPIMTELEQFSFGPADLSDIRDFSKNAVFKNDPKN